jgi:hypothetical protein
MRILSKNSGVAFRLEIYTRRNQFYINEAATVLVDGKSRSNHEGHEVTALDI